MSHDATPPQSTGRVGRSRDLDDAARDLEELLAESAEVLTRDFDPHKARERIEAVLRSQREHARLILLLVPFMLLSMFLLGPQLLRWANIESDGSGRWPAYVGVLQFAAVSVGWWWWSRRRAARALAAGPEQVRRLNDNLSRELRAGRWLMCLGGLIVGPTVIVLASRYLFDDDTALWWPITLIVMGLCFTVSGVRDGTRLVRTRRSRGKRP